MRKAWQPYHHPGPLSGNLGTLSSWTLWAPRVYDGTDFSFTWLRNSLDILTGRADEYIIRFYITRNNFNSLAPARNRIICPPLVQVWIVYLQTLPHFFNNPVTAPNPLPTDGNFEGSKEVEIWVSKIWAIRWLGKNSPSMFCDIFLLYTFIPTKLHLNLLY